MLKSYASMLFIKQKYIDFLNQKKIQKHYPNYANLIFWYTGLPGTLLFIQIAVFERNMCCIILCMVQPKKVKVLICFLSFFQPELTSETIVTTEVKVGTEKYS